MGGNLNRVFAITLLVCLTSTVALVPARSSQAQTGGLWSATGLDDASVSSLAVDPGDSRHILAIVGNGDSTRLARSTDGGVTWSRQNLHSSALKRIAFGPASSGVVYAAFDDGTVRRSTDGGQNWGPNRRVRPAPIVSLAVSPDNPYTVLATFDSKGAGEASLYRSDDGGTSWGPASSGLQGDIGRDLLFVPGSPPAVYVAMGSAAGDQGGVFTSTNNGATWTPAGLTQPGIRRLASDGAPSPALYALSDTLYVSRDMGASWAERPGLGSPFVTAHPSRPGTIFMSHGPNSWSLAVSSDYGVTWAADNIGIPGRVNIPGFVGALASSDLALSADGNVQYLATNGGVYKRTNVFDLPNLSVADIEVTQAIQTPSREVRLVRDRPTVARVYINVEGDRDVANVSALLYGARNGQQLPGSPLRPINAGGTIRAPLSPDPENFDHALNFLIPRSWHPDGILTLSAQVDPDDRVTEVNETDNRSTGYPTVFFELPPLEVVLIPIEYQRNGTGQTRRVDPKDLPLFGLQGVKDMFPIGRLRPLAHSPYRFTGDLTTSAGWSQLLNDLRNLRSRERPFSNSNDPLAMPKYYGLVPDYPVSGRYIAGMGQISGTVATGIASLPRAAAHELGHNFGLLHAPCGVLDGLDTNYPPSLGGRIGFVGFNVHTGEPIPASYYDMMSYCGERAWISAYNTERLFNVLSAVRARQASLAQTEQPAWLVNGAIAPDGLSGTLSFAEPISSTATIAEGGTGPHRIELWRGAELVFSHRFEAQVPAAHETDGLNASFTLVIPRPADITELRLLAGDTLLDGIAVDAAAPTVTAELAPFGVGTTPRSVQWGISPAATEPDIVSVRYSADGGQRWEVLGQINDPAITSLSFDLADLPESADGLIEVVATRGATSGSAQVSVGPVANKPPVVQIVQGEKLQVTTSEPLVLQGSAYDREDGVIADDRYSWRDASGQLLGSGPLLELPALDTLAQRMITLTVTDSDGAAAQATVYITAGERTYLPFARR